MDVPRRAPAGAALVLVAVALITVGPAASAGSTPAATVNGASGAKLVSFVRPAPDTLVQQGSDIPPAGVRLDTLAEDGTVRLDGQPAPGNRTCAPNRPGGLPCSDINYVVLDRRTLQRAASGSVEANVTGIKSLGAIIDTYKASLNYLVVLNWARFPGQPEAIVADRDALDTLLQKIGAQKLTAAQRQQITLDYIDRYSPGSAVGVAGAPAGSAFVTVGYVPKCGSGGCGPIGLRGGLSGSLRLNGVTSKYDFVFTDAVDFDTETNQTRTDVSPAQLTIRLGDRTYTKPNPGGSGFHLLVLNAKTLDPLREAVFKTNAPDGVNSNTVTQNMADDLASAVNDPDRPLVVLQAFGRPHGNDNPGSLLGKRNDPYSYWDEVARSIERLGGTRQVFEALNAVDPRPLNGESLDRKGPYAFVGRVGSTAPPAEASHSLNGLPGRLEGVLMRARDGGYEPMVAGPPAPDGQAPVNTELIRIADQAPQPFPAFKDANGRPIDAASAEAVQRFLGGQDPGMTALCSDTLSTCDIRKTYYGSIHSDWSSIEGDLIAAKDKCAVPHQGFTAAQCEGIRAELRDEVSMVAKVTTYFEGKDGLQAPLGAAGVTALANLNDISTQITDDVKPPDTENTTSDVLEVLSDVVHFGGAVATLGGYEHAESLGAALGSALALTAYATRRDGSPTLIGPQVTTAASKLGVELADRYNQAGDHLSDLGKLIVSDYGKLRAVASKVNAVPGSGETDWRIGDVSKAREGLVRAAQTTIYERLVPLAYPVMYDIGPIGARDWVCEGGALKANKHLFADQQDGAQFIGRFQHWTTVIAVAREHATGTIYDARIPGPPASILDTLFKPIDEGGLGLSKLEFYSPHNGFRYLPEDPGAPVLREDTKFDLNSLIEFPYRFSASARIHCSNIPDPPGNSG